MHRVWGEFSRWLTHVHLLSCCYQSLFHSKVICTSDSSCIFTVNSIISAVEGLDLNSTSPAQDPPLPHLAKLGFLPPTHHWQRKNALTQSARAELYGLTEGRPRHIWMNKNKASRKVRDRKHLGVLVCLCVYVCVCVCLCSCICDTLPLALLPVWLSVELWK